MFILLKIPLKTHLLPLVSIRLIKLFLPGHRHEDVMNKCSVNAEKIFFPFAIPNMPNLNPPYDTKVLKIQYPLFYPQL